jgi:hypothetical protein
MRRIKIPLAVLLAATCSCYESYRFSGSELTKLDRPYGHVDLVTRDGHHYDFDLSQEIQFGFSDGRTATARFSDIRILDSSRVFLGQLTNGKLVKFPIYTVTSFLIERPQRTAHLLARAGAVLFLLGGVIFIIVAVP